MEKQSDNSASPPNFSSRRILARRKKQLEAAAAAPPQSRLQRVFRFFFNPYTISAATVILAAFLLAGGYFWVQYSKKVDAFLLQGDVFTRSAGIYAAPKIIKTGESFGSEQLTAYLRSAGYIEKGQPADAGRSRYEKRETGAIIVTPGESSVIDNEKAFGQVEIEFDKTGKKVALITDIQTGKPVAQTLLEPKMLSSLASESAGRRRAVAFRDLPPHLVKAVTVTEDRAFFEHYGINIRGIARALWRRYEKEEDADRSAISNQGGSSLTQQLVKNLLLNSDPTIERKLKEALMSLILETRLSKEEIFTLYANQIYLGQQAGRGIYGVGEAASAYFGKDVTQLTLSEGAFLSGIIRSPNRYGPYKRLTVVTERRNQIISSMLEAGEITQTEADAARAETLLLQPAKNREELGDLAYFAQFAEEEMIKTVSDPKSLQHLRVYTTIDTDLQSAADLALRTRIDRLEKRFPKKPKGALQGALIAIRPKTGEIVAMVGGRNFLENQFNRAADAQRQPGSVFKPFVYATAINTPYNVVSRVVTAATVYMDEKKKFTSGRETYSPNNYGDAFSGQMTTVRDALVKSKNAITVEIGMQLGIDRVMTLAARAGMPRVEKAYPSMSLGTAEATPLQVATAYSVFANLGEKTSPVAISRLTDGEGTTVALPATEKRKVISPDVAYIINDMMKDVINRGTASEAKAWGFKNVAGKTAFAGKTGTSRDGWFAGFTPDLVCVVYVGFDNGDNLNMKGSDSAMPIWADFMRDALNRRPEWNGDWQMPASIRRAEIDIRDGSLIREISAGDVPDGGQAAGDKIKNTPTESPVLPAQLDSSGVPVVVETVPAQFRRIELFIGGSIPKNEQPENTAVDPNAPLTGAASPDNGEQPPFTTWQEYEKSKDETIEPPAEVADIPLKDEPTVPTLTIPDPLSAPGQQQQQQYPPPPAPTPPGTAKARRRNVSVLICPTTDMRATSACPVKILRTFTEGEEPKDFCTLHR